jgi:transcriptional pleiotropic repressor
MIADVLVKVRKLNWVLQESVTGTFSFDELCHLLSELMDSNVYITNKKGEVLGVHYKIRSESAAVKDTETGIEKIPSDYNDAMLMVTETEANLKAEAAMKIFKNDIATSDKYDKLHTVVPIIGGGQRLGTLILARYEPVYNDEDLVLAEYGAAVVGLEIQRQKAIEAEEEKRKISVVQMAIGTLSYSEIEAVQQIFKALEGKDGFLVASKVADRASLTRSVIVNALRKLESAGVIDSRSLGMKGTHIKILNDKFIEELEKLT